MPSLLQWHGERGQIKNVLQFGKVGGEVPILQKPSRENLETKIKANDKQLGLVQKLLWLVLTLVLGLFAKVIHLL